MFTGIIQEIGMVSRIERKHGVARLTLHAPKTAVRVRHFESVAIDGVCLSVVEVRGPHILFEVIPETSRLTTLGSLRAGAAVNVEPSLTLTDRLNGHFLLGHVDGVGRIIRRRQLAGELVLHIRVSPKLRHFLVSKGPIAIDGISLTIGEQLTASSFTIHLIPETLRQTTLRTVAIGEEVNVEIDYLAKLTRQFLRNR